MDNDTSIVQCPRCTQEFSKFANLKRHCMDQVCLSKNPEHSFECKGCSKFFLHHSSMYRHQKKCERAIALENITSSTIGISNDIITNSTLHNSKNITTTNTTNSHNTYTDNSTTNNNICINPVGKEDISHIDPATIVEIMQSGKRAFKRFIDEVYKNPANNNICFVNRKENRVKYMRRDNQIDIANTHEVVNHMLGEYEDKLDDMISDFNEMSDDENLKRILNELSNAQAAGKTDRKYMEIIINKIIAINEKSKQLLNAFERRQPVNPTV